MHLHEPDRPCPFPAVFPVPKNTPFWHPQFPLIFPVLFCTPICALIMSPLMINRCRRTHSVSKTHDQKIPHFSVLQKHPFWSLVFDPPFPRLPDVIISLLLWDTNWCCITYNTCPKRAQDTLFGRLMGTRPRSATPPFRSIYLIRPIYKNPRIAKSFGLSAWVWR